ncbi:MAG: hypothetical protein WBF75_07675 [Pseudonocardiaceae bacterium]
MAESASTGGQPEIGSPPSAMSGRNWPRRAFAVNTGTPHNAR